MLISSSFSQYLGYYKDKRLLTVFAFGISSGFPWVLIGSVMSAWLKDEGLSRSTIGLFGLVYGAYTINFLWSPLVDRIKIPLLYNRLGQRRSWIAGCQFIIIIATFALATISIKDHLSHAALLCFIIALFSATQDIAIDAYRIDILPEDESEKATAAAAMATSGWWSGYALLGAIPFFMADLPGFSWPIIYQMLSVIVVCLLVVTLLAKEPKSHREQVQAQLQKSYEHKLNHSASSNASKKIYAWLAVTLVEPFKRFFEKNGVKTACALLAFIFLFKIGEAFLARMSIVFYKEVGFSNTQIGQYSKLGTGVITIVFAFLGSIFNHKYGIVKGLFISGVAMAASNLMFSWIAIAGPKEHLYALAIVVDGFTQAWSLVAMVAFISMLCDRAFSATHYALLASLGSLGRTVLSGYSGFVIDDLLGGNWALFFALTALMVLPSLLFLYLIRHKLYAIEKAYHANKD
ncbi:MULTISPECIES: MFS transporter [Pseudoalteromonas]|uniref:AmpG family muropeptide MFS transporter n=1 Tax=Pseudoalteromonas TaxID=53246 RepID=UPI00029AA9B9|nr:MULTISPECIES: MFS transporter [Pseudoalteromonas]AUJ70981.1 muropeptide transporter [Pseudoalteromonas sp. NC201]MBR8843941.1 MFS transporter [Pseudoalteromonas sp. JC3]MCF2825144.1 MFS transporter [Pseudoalteromonas sp. OF5H-5]MCF2834018.1 MFS transporter [Pseudoalteromonas sp. DL2-H6]MCF2925616.1 MFS transporter [Pseudoalteromonas sp. DL2-H1]